MRAISIRWPSSTLCGATLRIVRSTGIRPPPRLGQRSRMTPEQLPGDKLPSFTVESEVSRWKRFARRGFLIGFSYPDPTPNGQAVDRDEKAFTGYARVHLSSRDRRELYLEVVRFPRPYPRGSSSPAHALSRRNASARTRPVR